MNDPYKTLGVSRDATDEEIKKAYRDLARKYHPDNYVDSPLSDLVQEKMKEINEAYDAIQKERSSGKSYGSTNSYSTGNSNYGGELQHARQLVNDGRYSEADIVLDSIPSQGRNAEWNFLKGCVLIQRGWALSRHGGAITMTLCAFLKRRAIWIPIIPNIGRRSAISGTKAAITVRPTVPIRRTPHPEDARHAICVPV